MTTTTTHSDFGAQTEGLDVAKAFASSVQGKTVIVTGVNRGGIGFSTAEAFASQSPAHLILASRTPSKVQECIAAIRSKYPDVDYRLLQIDLSSQNSVHAAAKEVLSWSNVPTVDILVNSAGISLLPERTLNDDGIEMHFATNHIGHFLFTCLITPKLIAAAKKNPKGATRVINVSSGSPRATRMRWSDRNFDKINKTLPEQEQPNYRLLRMFGVEGGEDLSYVPVEAYSQSKVANLLFSIGVNERLYEKHGILSIAVHPGVIQTELVRSAPLETVEAVAEAVKKGVYSYKTLGAGASTSMVAALDPMLKAGETVDGKENYGTFMMDCQISDTANPLAVSSTEAERLWKESEDLVKEHFEW